MAMEESTAIRAVTAVSNVCTAPSTPRRGTSAAGIVTAAASKAAWGLTLLCRDHFGELQQRCPGGVAVGEILPSRVLGDRLPLRQRIGAEVPHLHVGLAVDFGQFVVVDLGGL